MRMFKKLATTVGLVLVTGSIAFASQATPSGTPRQPTTTSGSTKKHKKHHKKHTAPNGTSTSSKAKPH